MKIEITEKKQNKLLGRLEVSGKLNFSGATPANDVVKETLAVELKVDKELMIIKNIYSKFSHQEAEFLAYVYDDKEQMNSTEVMTNHLRKQAEEAAKKAKEETGKKAEEPKQEEKTPAEEPKNESPAEETPTEKPKETVPEDTPTEEKKGE